MIWILIPFISNLNKAIWNSSDAQMNKLLSIFKRIYVREFECIFQPISTLKWICESFRCSDVECCKCIEREKTATAHSPYDPLTYWQSIFDKNETNRPHMAFIFLVWKLHTMHSLILCPEISFEFKIHIWMLLLLFAVASYPPQPRTVY